MKKGLEMSANGDNMIIKITAAGQDKVQYINPAGFRSRQCSDNFE